MAPGFQFCDRHLYKLLRFQITVIGQFVQLLANRSYSSCRISLCKLDRLPRLCRRYRKKNKKKTKNIKNKQKNIKIKNNKKVVVYGR